MKKLPTLAVDLLKELEEQYPDKAPNIKDEERLVWMKAGQAALVQHLKLRLDNSGLTNTVII